MRCFFKLLLLIPICFSGWVIAAPQLHYSVVASRYHNPDIFTQGLTIYEDQFFESSGLYNQSKWLIYPIQHPASTWEQMRSKPLFEYKFHKRYFAEGLTIFQKKIYLLTWNEHKVFIFDLNTHKELDRLRYSGEGWGLTSNNQYLIRSDGSHKLYFHWPDSFAIEKTIEVKDKGKKIDSINELEFAQGFIWANIWYQHKIVKINPETGEVVGELDLSSIAQPLQDHPEKVLNGIAWDEKREGFWITGKWWPKMFLIRVRANPSPSPKPNS